VTPAASGASLGALLLFGPLLGAELWQVEKRHVLASPGIALREGPSPAAGLVVQVPYGAQLTVQLAAEPGPPTELDGGIWGRWVLARWQGLQGYAFDAWLLGTPVPPLDCSALNAWASSLPAEGALVVEKLEEEGCAAERRSQGHQGGVLLVEERRCAERRGGLSLPGWSLAQGWFLARLCWGGLSLRREEPFPRDGARRWLDGGAFQLRRSGGRIEVGSPREGGVGPWLVLEEREGGVWMEWGGGG